VGLADAGHGVLALSVLPLGFAVAVFSSALPYTLEMVALRRLSMKTFGTLMSFEPAVAALAGVTLLHEQLTSPQWLAIGAVIVASVGAVSGER
jgi:inner membrane transporter RhtA